MKIGKVVATAVGGSLIILQIANHKGYINVNWAKVNKDLEKASKKLNNKASENQLSEALDKVTLNHTYKMCTEYCWHAHLCDPFQNHLRLNSLF